MYIVSPEIEAYLESLLPKRHPLFYELEKKSEAEGFPAVGPEVGTLLQILVKAINAEYIIELGSGFGYSALWMAQALPENGRIILTDNSEANMRAAKKNFEIMGLSDKMEFKFGNSLEIFADETDQFDIIFNDIDKEEYSEVVKLAHTRLRRGGLLITDNTLWNGKVAEENPDETTQAILEHNRLLKEDDGFITIQIPLRDGLSISLKK